MIPDTQVFQQKDKFMRTIGFLTIVILLFGCRGTEVKREYYENGNLSELSTVKGNKLHGLFKSYYINGSRKESGLYVNDHKDGKWESWYPSGELMLLRSYQLGKLVTLDGWDRSSNKTIKDCSGVFTFYYDDGKPLSTIEYLNCEMHGKWVSWYENGQKESEIYYNLGRPVGKWTYWKHDGEISKVEEYSDH